MVGGNAGVLRGGERRLRRLDHRRFGGVVIGLRGLVSRHDVGRGGSLFVIAGMDLLLFAGRDVVRGRVLPVLVVGLVRVMTVFAGRGADNMVLIVGRRRRAVARVGDRRALHAIIAAATAGIAMARALAAAGAVVGLFFGFAMGALVGLDQRLPIGDRDLVIVGMDFAEGEKAVAVAAIFDEGRLQRRFNAGDLGEVDVAAQLLALGGLEIKLFDAIAADHDHPGLFRVGGVDQHFAGHGSTLAGGGRGCRRAQGARTGDATVHLIRG